MKSDSPLRIRAKTSRAAAVKLFCLDCVGGTRAEVRDCTAKDCALYPHRPYQVSMPEKQAPSRTEQAESPNR